MKAILSLSTILLLTQACITESTSTTEDELGGTVLGSPVAVTADVYVDWVVLFDDHEPFTKGAPEIYLKCTTSGGRQIKLDLPGVNDEGKNYYPRKLITTLTTTESYINCSMYEADDGDSDDFIVTGTFTKSALRAAGSTCPAAINNDGVVVLASTSTASCTYWTNVGAP